MEMFFKPVHSPSAPDEIKPRRHHHHHQHHHHQDSQSHMSDGSSHFAGYTVFDDTDKNANERHRHSYHHHHDHHLHENPHHEAHCHHHTHQLPYSEEDEMHYNYHTPITVSRTLSSSLSSSSSSTSSSSWYTEASANNPFSVLHAVRPQHSLSCSNILDVRRGFQEDDSNEPVVFASIKHGTKGTVSHELHGSSQQRGKHVFSSLDRGHSRSEEGPLHDKESDLGEYSRSSHMNGPLYKTASLNRSLAFSEEDIQRGPKKAVSSSQLPSKGILKNREPPTDIRKAKSMEVLSPRFPKSQDLQGQKDKGITQAEIEQARANFVQGKLQFSAFLDEITKQVISPSDLTILGMNNSKSARKSLAPLTQTDSRIKPQLPPKKHRESSGEERKHHPKQHNRQEKGAFSGTQHHSGFSSPDKLISYSARNHHGSPPPHTPPYSHNSHHGSRHKNRRPSPTGGSVQRDRFGRCGPHLTDGNSNSPEPISPKQPHHPHHHHHKQHPAASHLPHAQPFHQTPPQQVHSDSGHQRPASSSSSSAQCAAGLGSESSSTKSDSSRARETASTAISEEWQTPSEKNGRYHSHHVGHSKQCRDTLSEATHIQVLQEENADLHQNLLQTVVCIESLEVELQRTKDELSHVKEKYKSLLEMHTGTKQANDLLGEHLHIASESMSSERKFLLNRVSQLSSELEAAHRTIAAIENINMPCVIKDLLEQRFDSAESIQKFLKASAPISCSATSPQENGQSQPPKVDEESHDQLTNPETGQQRVTAFIPFKQGVPKITAEASLSNQHESTHSQPISVADITSAIYKKMAAGYAARPQPLYPQSQQQPPLGTYENDTPSNLQSSHVGGDCWGGEGGVKVTLLEHDVVDVTSMTAQQILNDFMEQLQAHKDVGGEPEPRVRQE